MSLTSSMAIQVSVDVGCANHSVAIGLSTGEILDEFSIAHQPDGFKEFFSRIEAHKKNHQHPVLVAMEGYNGYARPLDG